MRVDTQKLTQFIEEITSLTRVQQRIYLHALGMSPIVSGSGDIARLAEISRCSRHTVARALRAIQARPILGQSITIRQWRRNAD